MKEEVDCVGASENDIATEDICFNCSDEGIGTAGVAGVERRLKRSWSKGTEQSFVWCSTEGGWKKQDEVRSRDMEAVLLFRLNEDDVDGSYSRD
jgi:hypothetical protein